MSEPATVSQTCPAQSSEAGSPAVPESGFSLKRIFAVFAGGNLLCMVLRFGGGLLVARVTRPEVLGLFNGIGLVMGYVPFAQLGVVNGLNRELPYYIGLDDRQKAYTLTACAQAWALAVGTACAAALAGFALWQFWQGRPELGAGWLAHAWLVFHFFYAQFYLQVTYRTGGDFSRLTTSNVLEYVSSFLLIVLVWRYGYYGMCVRAVLVSLVTFYVLWRWRPLRLAPAWHYESFKHLVKIGLPIIIVGQIYALWVVLNSTLILKLKGVHALGLFSVATMIGAAIELIPTSLSQICYPRMAEEYGRSGSLNATTKLVTKPVRYLALAYLPLVAASWFAAPPAVAWLLPKYVESIRALQWTCVASALLALSPINLVFLVLKRLDLYLAAILAGMASYAGCLYFLYARDHDLAIFPQALVVGRIVFLLACFGTVRYLKATNKYER